MIVRRGLAAAIALIGALVLTPGAAYAADTAVEYSTDGVSWSANPPASVFPAWVPSPGAQLSATLYVRGARQVPTVVGVYAGRASASDSVLLTSTRLAASGDAATDLAGLGACTAVAPQTVLSAGQVLAVPLALTISPDLTGGQFATFGFDLLVELSDTGVPVFREGCPVDPAIIAAFPGASSPSVLPSTGAEFPLAPLLAAVALLGGGLAAVLSPWRRRG